MIKLLIGLMLFSSMSSFATLSDSQCFDQKYLLNNSVSELSSLNNASWRTFTRDMRVPIVLFSNHVKSLLVDPSSVINRWENLGKRDEPGSCYKSGIQVDQECIEVKLSETFTSIKDLDCDNFKH